jgi:cell division protein ZapA
MAQVNVTVNGRQYSVGCNDGEEDHIAYLAEYVDKRVGELSQALGQVGEARLMLMAALLVADDLATAYDEAEALRGKLDELTGEADKVMKVAPRLGAMARRLDQMAAKLKV